MRRGPVTLSCVCLVVIVHVHCPVLFFDLWSLELESLCMLLAPKCASGFSAACIDPLTFGTVSHHINPLSPMWKARGCPDCLRSSRAFHYPCSCFITV